ncbi:DEAD/DEAH box helicase [Nocardioides sp. NPDC058538]|uniref:DEAD/DEAH box helicase n=1 Tax=Nocardioides sp. NPDC058538 TaxID=3346542 RepID=UPI0036523A2F
MKVDWFSSDGEFEADVQFGYVDKATKAPKNLNPSVVLNTERTSVFRTIRDELRHCDEFFFSVAFVTPGAIARLKQDIVDFDGKGTIVTADYLGFNPPTAFAELLNLRQHNVDVRFHPASAFHPKGYIFTRGSGVTAMVGSANLTDGALFKNHEWNLKVSATKSSDLSYQLHELAAQQIEESTPLDPAWVEEYKKRYVPPPPRRTVHAAEPGQPSEPDIPAVITPNQMQQIALESIASVRAAGNDKAIVISATGTGKTILSALDVRAVDPVRLLFVVHREQILDRTIEEYRRVLGGPDSNFGKVTGNFRQGDRRYVFATVQTLSRSGVLAGFAPNAFDYVIVDEAHRAASSSYRQVMEHFTPEFLLGLTATPERTDGVNVFELFDYNVPYEIRLNHALEEGMLSPFHYYGIADVTYDDGKTVNGDADLKRLISPERVDHLVKAIDTYGQAGVAPHGLIFCSSKAEARALSAALNKTELRGRQLRTVAVTGEDSIALREAKVDELETGHLDYILTVDVFNEGVDIPCINQVIMLRQTESAIVFVQQLGRGLRKAPGKDYLVVIDFIGNYANNYLIPIALFGDESLNKESLRQKLIAAEEEGVVPGLSSVRFDKISQERVLRSIATTKLDSLQNLKKAIDIQRNRLGRMPLLHDFLKFESTDPVLLATTKRHYPALLSHFYKEPTGLSKVEDQALTLLSSEVMTAKRLHEFVLVKMLFSSGSVAKSAVAEAFLKAGLPSGPRYVDSAIDTLTLERHGETDQKRLGAGIAVVSGDDVSLVGEVLAAYQGSSAFAEAVDDLVGTGSEVVTSRYLADRPFTSARQYGRKEATRLLTWPRSWTSTLYGYKVDRATRACPIFITLHKADDVDASTAYEDALLDPSTVQWFTRSRRTLKSVEVRAIVDNDVDLHIFVKKDDAEGSDFYYLGQATSSAAEQATMPDSSGKPLDVVRMFLRFDEPIDSALYDYFHPTLTVE